MRFLPPIFKVSQIDGPWYVWAKHTYDGLIVLYLFLSFYPKSGISDSLGKESYSQLSSIFTNLFFLVFVLFIIWWTNTSLSAISDLSITFTMIIWPTSTCVISLELIALYGNWSLISSIYLSLSNSITWHLKTNAKQVHMNRCACCDIPHDEDQQPNTFRVAQACQTRWWCSACNHKPSLVKIGCNSLMRTKRRIHQNTVPACSISIDSCRDIAIHDKTKIWNN